MKRKTSIGFHQTNAQFINYWLKNGLDNWDSLFRENAYANYESCGLYNFQKKTNFTLISDCFRNFIADVQHASYAFDYEPDFLSSHIILTNSTNRYEMVKNEKKNVQDSQKNTHTHTLSKTQ